jgi:hypothetical protein
MPVRDSHTRIKPFTLASGHGRYTTVTPNGPLACQSLGNGPLHISRRDSSWTPGVFYTCFYNHARRLRLGKLLYLELSRSSSGFFLALLDPGGGFRSETAVTKPFRK